MIRQGLKLLKLRFEFIYLLHRTSDLARILDRKLILTREPEPESAGAYTLGDLVVLEEEFDVQDEFP